MLLFHGGCRTNHTQQTHPGFFKLLSTNPTCKRQGVLIKNTNTPKGQHQQQQHHYTIIQAPTLFIRVQSTAVVVIPQIAAMLFRNALGNKHIAILQPALPPVTTVMPTAGHSLATETVARDRPCYTLFLSWSTLLSFKKPME